MTDTDKKKTRDFAALVLKPELLSNLTRLKYLKMTDIQALSLPAILAGQDVIARAKTGSGKTAAFGLGLLEKLDVKRFRIQSLVLCPTRELADQVAKEIRSLGREIHNIKILTLCGGAPLGPQIGSLEHGAHIVVGTPGRIHEHLRKGTLKLEHVTTLVLDEADRMLDMGFQATLDAIIDKVPSERQTLLFSATYPDQIRDIAIRIMKDALTVEATSTHNDGSIEQHFYLVEEAERIAALRLLLLEFRPSSTLVFCNTKRETQAVADALKEFGFSAIALHGDMEQRDRDQTLIRFSNNSVSVLVATDVAARGLDITKLDAVINYQIAREQEVHVHRIGRTGRAGEQGIAMSLYNERETRRMNALQDYLGLHIETRPLPNLDMLDQQTFKPAMATLQISGGKKQKVRAGDILGALTGDDGIEGHEVGKINLFDNHAYVAVKRKAVSVALDKLSRGKMKGRSYRIRRI